MSGYIDRAFGRSAFGADAAAYHKARPEYPGWVYEDLKERCNLAPCTATFEIGAGTGTATRRLLDLGANPLVAVEPDHRMAAFLRASVPEGSLTLVVSPFEEADLGEAKFDLGVCFTAFHWLDEDPALSKVASLLKVGGWWVAVWNVFGDFTQPDPFHEATQGILQGLSSPAAGSGIEFALDCKARQEALDRSGAFDLIEHRTSKWPLVLDAEQTVALYGTYSNVNIRSDREDVLSELGRIAREEFAGRVVRNMITSMYLARRTA